MTLGLSGSLPRRGRWVRGVGGPGPLEPNMGMYCQLLVERRYFTLGIEHIFPFKAFLIQDTGKCLSSNKAIFRRNHPFCGNSRGISFLSVMSVCFLWFLQWEMKRCLT